MAQSNHASRNANKQFAFPSFLRFIGYSLRCEASNTPSSFSKAKSVKIKQNPPQTVHSTVWNHREWYFSQLAILSSQEKPEKHRTSSADFHVQLVFPFRSKIYETKNVLLLVFMVVIEVLLVSAFIVLPATTHNRKSNLTFNDFLFQHWERKRFDVRCRE